jgi:hypothetical protein
MDTLSKSLVCAADVRTISIWLDLKIPTVFLDLNVHLRGVGGEAVYQQGSLRRRHGQIATSFSDHFTSDRLLR